jgi:DNA-binding transcriptional ArsR family regulator
LVRRRRALPRRHVLGRSAPASGLPVRRQVGDGGAVRAPVWSAPPADQHPPARRGRRPVRSLKPWRHPEPQGYYFDIRSIVEETSTPVSVASGADQGVCEVEVLHPEAVRRVRAALPDEEVMQRVAAVFQVLADPTRARIVYALSVEELCVCDVAAVAGLSVSAASHQLKWLRDQGVARFRRDGRLAYYTLRDEHVRRLVQDGVARVRQVAG